MKNESQIRDYLDALYTELKHIENSIPAGNCYWRICKAKIELLQWVINEE